MDNIILQQKTATRHITGKAAAHRHFRPAKAAKRFLGMALLAATIMVASSQAAFAQSAGQEKPGDATGKGGKELVLEKPMVKPYLNLKGFGRLYDGGKTAGMGLGIETGLSMGGATAGGSLSFAKEGEGKGKIEESSIFVAVPIGKTTLAGYGYTDLFLKQAVPAYGINISGYGVKLGGEISPYRDANGDWVAYAKVPLGDFTPGVGIAGWGDGGWQGGAKKFVLTFNAEHSLGNGVVLNTETLYGIKLQKGSEGYLQFRMTLNYAAF
ncbi:MAG: hypothetical protein WC506_04495 [Candidatus Micrarchaeia archaeon]